MQSTMCKRNHLRPQTRNQTLCLVPPHVLEAVSRGSNRNDLHKMLATSALGRWAGAVVKDGNRKVPGDG